MNEERKVGNPENTGENSKNERKIISSIKPYLAVGLTAIIVVVACMAIFFVVLRFGALIEGVKSLGSILQGIIFGCIIAYVLNPVMTFFERRMKKALGRTKLSATKIHQISRTFGTAIATVILIVAIAVLVAMIIPQVITTVQDVIKVLPDGIQSLINQVEEYTRADGDGEVASVAKDIITRGTEYLETWIRENLLNQASDWFSTITSGVIGAVKLIFNFIVGIIVSCYILMRKETFINQTKKLIYAIFKPRQANIVMEVLRKSDDIFGGFLIGKIIDSIIVGIICFIVLTIVNMPFALLVSVIVGVTNIIPVFGPYIGAIPSFVLILMVDPLHALYFLIIIIILQQVDGNIIGPKILGNSTGLSPFWIIFAILLFGGAFGIIGMLFGVPIFAVIYYIIKRVAEYYLGKRKLPIDTKEYLDLDHVDVKTEEPIFYDVDRDTRHMQHKEEMGGMFVRMARKKREKANENDKNQKQENEN